LESRGLTSNIVRPCFFAFLPIQFKYMKKLIPQKIKNIYHLLQAIWANIYFGFPSKKIKVIGVTGTNGKTTTVQMITKILEEAGFQVAMASTINFKVGEETWVNKTKFTTLSAFAVQEFIQKAITGKCDYLVLETSSHSLDQYRVWGVDYDIAVMTNVTREHLDYHETMENYRQVKKELFTKAKEIVVNLDMENPEEFLDCKAEKKITYSLKDEKADILAENIFLGLIESRFSVQGREYRLNLLGDFNIENALAAIAVGTLENIKVENMIEALDKIKEVPGRLEYIPNGKKLRIIIDYALTPDALEKLYALLKKLNKNNGKIIAVFGACGERDRGKRPIMGEIVSQNANYIIVTNEDPYNEDPEQIMEEIVAGIKNKEKGHNFWKIPDRRQAIHKALHLAKEGDFVVVTGKGAEETMAIGKERIPWNDKKVIQEELEK